MRIEMLVSQAGPSLSRRARCVYELRDDAEAQRLIDSGAAIATEEPCSITEVLTTEPVVETPPAVEEVTEPAVETPDETAAITEDAPPPKTEPKAEKAKKRGK